MRAAARLWTAGSPRPSLVEEHRAPPAPERRREAENFPMRALCCYLAAAKMASAMA